MMEFVPHPLSWVLCLVGVVTFIFCANKSGKRITVAESGRRVWRELDPLKSSGISSKGRTTILVMIMRRSLPEHLQTRTLAFKRVAYDVTVGAEALRWLPFLVLGLVLAFCGFYPVPIASTVAVVIQCAIVVFMAFQYRIDRRRLTNSRELLRAGWVEGHDASAVTDSESHTKRLADPPDHPTR
jgi:hypothetical protein